ncbi:MAG: hypothetical protein UR66_C0003G0121 [Candidatus Moranbacteria bacterium GW2011_GWE1_35_17]|nr:MAG: hypothetical protein UR66_C0003G0121 [Candidatus Moranbacteria bacterium GW2011_GWE1_35_17]KKP84603.1 MAG: hypothetical protein UR82_C0002G0020 [Candidatus Moranbacteria bacterium GW2011_GWF1_35_5]
MQKNKKQIKIKLKTPKKISLWKSFFTSLFKKKSKKEAVFELKNTKAKSIAEFLDKYELKNKKSLGRKYRFRKIILRGVDLIEKSIKITWKISVWSFFRVTEMVLLVVLIFSSNSGVLSAPKAVTVTNKADWEKGALDNISTTSGNDAIQLKSDGTWNARTWAPTPDTIAFGSSSALVGDYLYVTRGYADKSFYRYNIEENKWDILADLPQATHYGCDMAYDGVGNIYFIFGGFSKEFYKYNIEDATWIQLPNLLDTIYTGAAIEFDGTDMFITRGQSSTDFWKFDISENAWYNTAPVPATLNTGSSMVYGNNSYMYVTRGTNTNTLYRYNIGANNWSTLTNTPNNFNGEQKGVFYNNSVYFLVSNTTNTFLRYDIAGNSWVTLATSPQTNNLSSLTFNSADNLIYAIRGSYTYNLWKFDPDLGATGTWLGPQDLPAAAGTGGDFIWNKVTGAGAYVYALRGGANSFYRFDIATNTWTAMTNAPVSFSWDTKGTYYNGYIYIPLGNNTTAFYRYDVAGNSWSTMTVAPGTLGGGSAAVYNSGDGYIYVTRGNGTNNLYRYNIAGNSWTTMANMAIAGGADYRVYTGGRIESDGTNLYMMPGDGETAFLRYNAGANNWTELTATSFAQYYGTDISYYDGKIYAIAGYYKDETWEYNIAANAWRQLPNNQKYVYERGPYNGASFEYIGNNSFLAMPGFGLVDVWSYTLGTNNYLNSGIYISEEIDLSYASSWTSLNVNQSTPANTNIITETRTSSDGETWSGWEAVSGGNIASPENRYIQVKLTLSTTDSISTPTVYDFTISYNSEDNAPSNPATVTAYSQKISGEVLTSSVDYKYAHPYFSWNDGGDSESGIAGYWVYFGNDDEADPELVGTYQEDNDYSVNLAMINENYYLKIKAQDSDGNVSTSVWDAFTYSYSGVAPYLTEEKTSEADFLSGTFDKTSIKSDGSFRLDSIAGFWNEKRLSYAPAGFRYGADLAYIESSDKIYILRGDNTTTFYSYDIATDVWSTLAVAPATVRFGSSMINGPEGYLYASRGNDTADFWRYDIANNLWEVMSSAPKVFTYGGSINYDGSRYVYGLPGNDDAFFRYDTQNNIWTTLENAEFGNPNESDGQRLYEGSDNAYDKNDTLYVAQGNNYPYFSKYSISSGQWTPLEKAPVGIYEGGCLTYDSVTNAVYMLSGKYRQNFFRYNIDSNTWTEMPLIPSYVAYGGSIKAVDGYIYAIRGEGSNAFYRFNTDENSWEVPQKGFFGPSDVGGGSSFSFSYGTNMVKDENENIYLTRGSSDNTFGKYNYQTGEFTQLAKTPVGIYNGSAMVYNEDEGAIYLAPGAIRTVRSGGINNYFMKYIISSNSWEIITTDRIPLQTGTGSTMTYDGSRYIYLTRGTAGNNNWWRYDTIAVSGSRWSALLPTIANWNQGDGSRILYKDGYVYSTRAQNQNTFWRYDVTAGTWLQRANTPATIGIGASLTDGNDGYLYLTRGINTNTYYRYNIDSNTWETISNVPGQINIGGAGDSAGNRIWSTTGNGTNSYNDGLYSYVVGSESNSTAFEKRGNYISEAIDLLSVYRWANLEINYTKPNNTSVNIYTRTSSDQNDWSAWDLVNNEKELGLNNYRYDIVSPVNEYIQVKVDLFSGDQIFSPSISDYKINYYQDVLAPSNPSAVNAYSAADKTVAINAASWYGHLNPYFEWPADELAGGASDGIGGSGVKGYWVYFGTNASADAFVDGAYQTGTNYTANNIVSGQNYYLLIKATDDANILPAASFNAFNYRFDNTPPNNPTDISVTPAGFTAVDNYSFLWENNISDAHSGVQKIQYRTGGDATDTWVDVPNITDVSVTIPNAMHVTGAYQSGKNWLYLRVMDNAGNVSAPISQEYYYSADAPSPPENLAVTPAYSTGNSFAFDWDQPLSFIGEASKLKYYYSINTLPNAYNVVETTSTFAGPGPFATQKGANRFYVVAMDEAGNIDYDLAAHIDFTADTSAPGAPVNIQIFDTSDRENAEYSVATKWTPPVGASSDNFEGYVIYRSTELDGTYASVATTSGTAYVDTGLESKPYYYYIKAKDNTNNLSVASSIVTIIPTGRYTTAPTLIQKPTVKTQSFIATFNWGTSRVASSFVEYGKSISLGETNGQVDSVTDHEVIINGLSADTKYFYKVKYIDPDGNIGTSEIGNFTTLPPPVVSEFAVTEIKLDSALISWKTNTSATCILKYGAGSLSNTIEETDGASAHIQKVVGLVAETDYQAQVDCVDGDLNDFNSDQYNFATPIKPIATDITVQNVENVDLPTILIEYKTNIKATTHLYYKSSEESTPHTYLTEEKTIEHKAEIRGLDPAKEYVLTIIGTDENGITLEPVEQKITTKSDSRPPEITINRAVGKVLGRGASSQANLYVKIETNEPTKLKIKYTKGASVSGFDQSTGEDPLNTYHLMTIPAEVGQMYSYQAEVFDEAGNLTNSKVSTIIVEDAKSSASEIIIGTTTKQFGWLSEIWNK